METRFIDNGGVRLFCSRAGSGARHVLFVHGWISSHRMWDLVAARLDPKDFTLHRLDFRGCGRSDRPMAGHDLAGYAADLRCALDAIGQPLTVVAHSMGAKVAQFVACERPAAIRKLALVAPGSASAYVAGPKHRDLALDAFGSRVKIEAFQRAAMTKIPAAEVMETLVEDALLGQHEAWFGWYDNGRSADFSELLERITVPAIALAGERDPLAPPGRVKREVAARIAGCLFVMLRGVGHNLPVEAPDEIAGMIERFA